MLARERMTVLPHEQQPIGFGPHDDDDRPAVLDDLDVVRLVRPRCARCRRAS